MSLLAVSRRLQGPPTQLFSRFLHSITRSTPHSPLGTLSPFLPYFPPTFYRTPSIPSYTSFQLSPFKPFSTQILDYSFELIQPRIQPDDPLKSGLLQSLKKAADFPTEAEAIAFLDESGIEPNGEVINLVIWVIREDWRLAVLGFKWAEKRGCVDNKARDLIIWVLGTHKKFNTAWILIRDWHNSAVNSRRPMLVMIDRYAAANIPGKAIWAFELMEKFRPSPDEEAYHFLLSALCKHGFIDEAEEFMHLNKKLFPLETVGFNIILNGWCNIYVDVLEAKRIWKEMSRCCITPDAASYTHMISCFSKVGNLFDSLRLCDGMKKRGWVPGLEVYNSLVYVLTRENCLKEALNIIDKVKDDGLQPDANTYNSMIRPLCEAGKLEEARNALACMIEENISPTVETYHALIEGTGPEGTQEILEQMRLAGLGPSSNTFVLVLSKLFKLEKPDEALRMWEEMKGFEVMPNMAHYHVMVEGLVKCGLITKARKYLAEMRSNGFSDEPKLQKLLMQPVQGKNEKRKQWGKQVQQDRCSSRKAGSMVRKKNIRFKSKGKDKVT